MKTPNLHLYEVINKTNIMDYIVHILSWSVLLSDWNDNYPYPLTNK